MLTNNVHKVLELVISWGKKGSLRIAIVGTVLGSLINGQEPVSWGYAHQ